MGSVNYQIPTVGAPNSTEDPKVATALTQIAAVLNGHVDGTNIDPAYTSPAFVTTLPAGPVDGQHIYFLQDAAAGVIWHLRYRAASASPYKWEFLGGGSLLIGDQTPRPGVSGGIGAWLVPTGSAAIITVPLAGDYEIAGTVSVSQATANTVTEVNAALVSAPTVPLLPAFTPFETHNSGEIVALPYQGRAVGLTGGNTISPALTFQTAAITFIVASQTLRVTPVRVG